MKSGCEVNIHWPNVKKDGLIYVMLGRSERLEDIYISGELDVSKIACNPEALQESKRLEEVFNQSEKEEEEKRAKCIKISYLNVQSMKTEDGHAKDVERDNVIMDADMFGLGETWLEKGSEVHFDGYSGHFANYGRGKGVAGYSKIDLVAQPEIVSTETFSAIMFKTKDFHIVFLYLSSNCKKADLFNHLDSWIEKDVPTAIMGDINVDFLKGEKLRKASTQFGNMMTVRGFRQLIKEPTFTNGNVTSVIDHVYVNSGLESQTISTKVHGVYYSSHDIISLYVAKKK